MVQVIAIAQMKGGVGKTTVAVNLANEIHDLGHSIILIDCDPQGSAMLWAEPKRLPFEVRHELLGLRPQVVWVRNVLKAPGAFVILDTPANLASSLDAVALIADVIAIPCGPSSLDILSAKKTIAALRQPSRLDPGLRPAIVLVPTRVDTSTDEGAQLSDELRETGELVAPHLSYDASFVRSFATGQAVAAFSPGSRTHDEVRSLAAFMYESFLASPNLG